MTADDLADLLVTHFNGLDGKPIQYRAENREEIPDVEKELQPNYTVFVIPYAENEESFDRGDTCREEIVCSLVVQGPLNSSQKRAKASELVRFLKFSLRETVLGGAKWDSNETVSLWDAEAMNAKAQFLSVFRAAYYQFA